MSLGHGGAFDAYAVTSRWGPHVTLQAGVFHLGKYWTTTARGSLKARAVGRHGWASVTAGDPAGFRIAGGPSRVLDPRRPWTLAAAPVDGALAGGALVRLAAGQLDQLVGYAEAGRGVPDAFLPWGRVILVTDVRDEVAVEGEAVTRTRGRWTDPEPLALPSRPTRRRWAPLGALRDLPEAVAGLGSADGDCSLGLAAAGGAVSVPGRWDAGAGRVRVRRDLLEALGVRLPGSACVTIHVSASRRPDRKLGLMLRGTASVAAVDPRTVEVGLHPARITYWEGFAAGTVTVPR